MTARVSWRVVAVLLTLACACDRGEKRPSTTTFPELAGPKTAPPLIPGAPRAAASARPDGSVTRDR